MKWVAVSSNANLETYELWDADVKILSLGFNPLTNSVRIVSEEGKRVFHIRKEGFLRNKTILRNEYGVRIGQVIYEKGKAAEGIIDLQTEKFNYRVNGGSSPVLNIFREAQSEPLMSCSLRENDLFHFDKNDDLGAAEQVLLLSLCWYTFLPVAEKHILQYAS